MAVIMRASGQFYVARRLTAMPRRLHRLLRRRTEQVTTSLRAAVTEAAPVKTGKLRSEIASRVYHDSPSRIAGYVYVAAQDQHEIAKATSLEYGIKGTPRAIKDAAQGVWMRQRHTSNRIKARLSRPVMLSARRYLRGPFEPAMAEYEAAVAEVVAAESIRINGGE